MTANDQLASHVGFASRRSASEAKLNSIGGDLHGNPHVGKLVGTIFAAGSYGRLEAGPRSDLDLFVIENIERDNNLNALERVRLLSALTDINDRNGCPAFDGEMRFFKVYSTKELIEYTGKPIDDTENSFTARMLLLLEGRPLYGDDEFEAAVARVAGNYFRDNKGKKDFRPLFLLNDLLRYWRTLCLNYEESRSDPRRKWRKKNLNLRFSRLSTVFATVIVLLTYRPAQADEFLPFVRMTPFERLASAVDDLNDKGLTDRFGMFLTHYHWFLALKDERGEERLLDRGHLDEARKRAGGVSQFFQYALGCERLRDYSRYLVL